MQIWFSETPLAAMEKESYCGFEADVSVRGWPKESGICSINMLYSQVVQYWISKLYSEMIYY